MARHFSQLTKVQIREIYVGFLSEEPKLRIARRLQIDNATVHYHINKIRHLPRAQVYALIAPPCAEGHISLKCLVCGLPFDNIKSNEFQEIIRLRKQVDQLERALRSRVPANSNRDRDRIGDRPSPVVSFAR